MTTKTKYISALVGLCTLLAGMVAMQNLAPVNLQFLIWTKSDVPLIFVILGCFLLGLLAGYLMGWLKGRHSPHH